VSLGKSTKQVLPFKVSPGAGAISCNVVHLIDALTVFALGVSLLTVVLCYVTEQTLRLLFLERVLWNPEVVITAGRIILIELTFFAELW
jgi:hypothetical protein